MKTMISTQPVVSVIIPVYNLENYVEVALQSVAAQTFTSFEVFVIDDGSTDNSAAILRRWAERDARFSVVTIPNQGVAWARQEGVLRAQGAYICFLDGDDFWEPDMLKNMVAAITGGPDGYDVVCCNFKRICPTYKTTIREEHTADMEGVTFLEAILQHAIMVTLCGKIYRRELFDKQHHHYPLRLGEDSLLNIQIACLCPRVHFIDYVGYGYVQRAGSANHQGFNMDYCHRFSEVVEAELQLHNKELNGLAEYYALLNKLRWFLVYIRKSSSPWAGDAEEAKHLYRLMDRYALELKRCYAPWKIRLIKMYRFRVLKPVVIVFSLVMRLHNSLQRRLN